MPFDDYARMMQVKPAIFDKVVANARHLIAGRTAGYPGVVLQFLLDRRNFSKLPEMYRLGRSIGADVLAINVVYDIPLQRIDSSVLLGNGDLYPCCLLLNPEYKPLGNASTGSFLEQWHGPTFSRMRTEMREVFLTDGRTRYAPERFQTIRSECVEPYRCWLKSIYFRGDEDFYRELGEALAIARRREVRWLGTPVQILRKAEMRAATSPRFRAIYDGLRDRSRPLRHWLRRRLRPGVRHAGSG